MRTLCVVSLSVLLSIATAQADLLELDWVNTYGGASSDPVRDVVTDADGNIYVAGDFRGAVDFDPGLGTSTLTPVGQADVYVAKFDSDGELVWVRSAGSTGDEFGECVAVDTDGNVYAGGSFRTTVDFDPSLGMSNLTSVGVGDAFVWKLDSNGDFVWARSMGSSGADTVNGIGADASGNVFTTGVYSATMDFDPGAPNTATPNLGGLDSYICKFDSSGNFGWVRTYATGGTEIGENLTLTSSGNILATGLYSGTIDFDASGSVVNLSAVGGWDAYLCELDSGGALVWARSVGGSNSDEGVDIAIDNLDNIYLTGDYGGTADFDPGVGTTEFTSSGGADIFLAKFTSAGNFMWARSFGGASADEARAIFIDSNNSPYVLSSFSGSSTHGATTLMSLGGFDIALTKVDAGGAVQWAHRIGGSGTDGANGIVADTDHVVVVGGFSGTVDFDPTAGVEERTSSAADDTFILRLAQDITPPEAITITPGTTGPTNQSSIEFTITFDEDVVNFDDDTDLVITHSGTTHTGVDFDGGPAEYTVTVQGISGDGSFTVAASISSDTQDLAGLVVGSSVTSAAVLIDNTAPVISLTSVSDETPSQGDTITIVLDVTDPLQGEPELTINGNSATHLSKAAHTFEYTVLPTDPLGPATLEATALDTAGNVGTLTLPSAITVTPPGAELPIAAWPVAAALLALAGIGSRKRRTRNEG